jgi:hypothetical protein
MDEEICHRILVDGIQRSCCRGRIQGLKNLDRTIQRKTHDERRRPRHGPISAVSGEDGTAATTNSLSLDQASPERI